MHNTVPSLCNLHLLQVFPLHGQAYLLDVAVTARASVSSSFFFGGGAFLFMCTYLSSTSTRH